MENILPRREARENAFLLAFSQTFGDIPLQEALDNHHECDEEHPVDVFGQRLLRAYYEHSAEVDDLISAHLRNWTMERLPRREARENAFLLAFSQTFGDIPLQEALDNHHECDEEHPVDVFGQRLLRAYYEHSAEVDDLISAHLRNWTMERLPRVSLTVLRLGLAEMLYGDEKKPGVVINEAVELTKKYGADEDYQFVNGLLGTVAREQGLDAEPEQL